MRKENENQKRENANLILVGPVIDNKFFNTKIEQTISTDRMDMSFEDSLSF